MPGVMPQALEFGMDEVRTLIGLLREAETLLRSHGVDYWAEWLARDAAQIEADEFEGVEDLLGAFGGMGSFNDLVLYSGNGHNMREGDVAAVNRHLDELRSDIYATAKQLEDKGRLPHRAA